MTPNRKHRVHTTKSWDFLDLNYYQSTATELLHKANYGENVIIGVIDSDQSGLFAKDASRGRGRTRTTKQ